LKQLRHVVCITVSPDGQGGVSTAVLRPLVSSTKLFDKLFNKLF
jgi:hypothetical protein